MNQNSSNRQANNQFLKFLKNQTPGTTAQGAHGTTGGGISHDLIKMLKNQNDAKMGNFYIPKLP